MTFRLKIAFFAMLLFFGVWVPTSALSEVTARSKPAEAGASSTNNATTSAVALTSTSTKYVYDMTCMVNGPRIPKVSGLTGKVNFLDTTANTTLATASLSPNVLGFTSQTLNLSSPANPTIWGTVTDDFNGDGKLDLTVISGTALLMYSGNGDGTFQAPKQTQIPLSSGTYFKYLVVGDFNGDKKPDLAFFGFRWDGLLFGVEVFLGNGDGTFKEGPTFPLDTKVNLTNLVVGDFNGDGKLDLAYGLSTGTTSPEISTITVAFGNGDGTFNGAAPFALNVSGTEIMTGDFNGDGKADLLIGNQKELTVYLSNGDGTFELTYSHSSNFVGIADLNGDGKLDIGGGTILLGKGDGTFTPSQVVNTQPTYLADFNGDGLVDLVTTSTTEVRFQFGNGDGTFQPIATVEGQAGRNVLIPGDFSGNGYSDFVDLVVTPASLLIWLNGDSASANTVDTAVAAGAWTNHEIACQYEGDSNYAESDIGNQVAVTFPQAPAPALSLPLGTYSTPQTVTISDTLSGAAIYYTLDGTTPTPSSALYSKPITVAHSETLKAVAVAADYAWSTTAEAVYTIGQPLAAPVFSLPAGLYSSAQSVTITEATSGAVIYYTLDGSLPTTASTKYSGAISISKTTTLQAIAALSGGTTSAVVSALYTIEAITTKPYFSQPSGIFGTELSITLQDTNKSAVLYYTVNGATPTSASTRYTAPILVTGSETIKAIALAPNDQASPVVSAGYTLAGTPSVLIGQATAIGMAGGTLNALVNPLGVAATYSFKYGTSATALTSATNTLTLAATSAPVNVSAALTGLKAKTKYYFSAVVTTVGGSATSAVETFTTE